MRHVKITLYGTLRTSGPTPTIPESLETSASSVEELLDEIHVPKEQAAIVFVNGKRAAFESEIGDGYEIKIFPMLGGG